jgi:hypothetical protein
MAVSRRRLSFCRPPCRQMPVSRHRRRPAVMVGGYGAPLWWALCNDPPRGGRCLVMFKAVTFRSDACSAVARSLSSSALMSNRVLSALQLSTRQRFVSSVNLAVAWCSAGASEPSGADQRHCAISGAAGVPKTVTPATHFGNVGPYGVADVRGFVTPATVIHLCAPRFHHPARPALRLAVCRRRLHQWPFLSYTRQALPERQQAEGPDASP